MVQQVECVVVGAGVVGLAIARALATAKREVLVLEADSAVGTGVSSRNSEVVHAGLYYAKNSAKAIQCVRGRRLLYAYCAERNIPHKVTGKLIVATTEAEVPVLHDLHARAVANGVGTVQFLSGPEAVRMEPALRCVAALHVQVTGIVDTQALMRTLQADAEAAGTTFVMRTPFRLAHAASGFDIEAGVGTDVTRFKSRFLINAAGLNAQSVASRVSRMQEALIPKRYLSKGSYFTLAGKAPFSRLVYPVPDAAGLGIHYTMDIQGRGRFGPDQEWVQDAEYTVRPDKVAAFQTAIRRYYPDLKDGALQPGYAGIRPSLQGPGAPQADFVIQDYAKHGIRGLVNLFGIDSPGLTSALALAGEVLVLAK